MNNGIYLESGIVHFMDDNYKKDVVSKIETNNSFMRHQRDYVYSYDVKREFEFLKNAKIDNNFSCKDRKYDGDELYEMLPNDFKTTIQYFTREFEIDPISPMLGVLTAVSIASRGRYNVCVTDEYKEHFSIFAVVGRESGGRKSAFVDTLKGPFSKYIDSLNLKSRPIVENDDVRKIMSKIKKNEVCKQILGAIERGEDYSGIYKDYSEMADKHFLDKKYRIFFENATGLQLAKIMRDNSETASIIDSEPSFFTSRLFKDEILINILLKSYCSDSYNYDSSRNSNIFLRNPSMNIFAMVQKPPLFNLYKNQNLEDRGVLARFLPHISSHEVSDSVRSMNLLASKDDYYQKIHKLLEYNFFRKKERNMENIYMEKGAVYRINLYRYEYNKNKHLFPNNMMSFINKIHGHVLRIAAALCFWRSGICESYKITEDDINFGIKFLEIIIGDYGVLISQEENIALNAKNIYESLCKFRFYHEIPCVDVSSIASVSNKKIHVCMPALELLEKKNYLKILYANNKKPVCILNPNFFGYPPKLF